MILYHGKQRFNYSTNIRDLVDGSEEELHYLFDEAIKLIDLSQIPDEEILKDVNFPLCFIELVLRHVFDADIVKYMNKSKAFMGLFKQYAKQLGPRKALVILHYLHESCNVINKEQFGNIVSTVDPVLEREYMTLKEAFFSDGRQHQQALTASKMLADEEPIDKIIKFSGLTAKQIYRLKKDQSEVIED